MYSTIKYDNGTYTVTVVLCVAIGGMLKYLISGNWGLNFQVHRDWNISYNNPCDITKSAILKKVQTWYLYLAEKHRQLFPYMYMYFSIY